eukprot:1522667-Amphidinium_carterae.1
MIFIYSKLEVQLGQCRLVKEQIHSPHQGQGPTPPQFHESTCRCIYRTAATWSDDGLDTGLPRLSSFLATAGKPNSCPIIEHCASRVLHWKG